MKPALFTLAVACALLGAATSRATPPALVVVSNDPSSLDCATRTFSFSVEAPGAANADGSAAKPFGTLGAAFAAVAKRNACALNIVLGSGEYAESIATTIPHVSIKSTTSRRPVVRGTIEHRGGGLLTLTGLDVAHASRVAIREVGGRVSLTGVRVTDTMALKNDIDSGIGLWVTDAEAVVRFCYFERNGSNAVRVEGGPARLWMQADVVRDTGAHPLVLARSKSTPPLPNVDLGAVLVTRGAQAWLSGLTIEDSASAGIDVAERARARIEQVTVRRTTGDGAQGIAVHNDAVVEAFNANVIDSKACGFAAISAALTSNNGVLTQAPVGACVSNPRMNLSCLQRGTQYRVVGAPLQGDHYDVPAFNAPTPPPCPSVDARAVPSWR